jgi:hypothetical protein
MRKNICLSVFFVKEKLSSPLLEKEKTFHRPLKKEKILVSPWSKKNFSSPPLKKGPARMTWSDGD